MFLCGIQDFVLVLEIVLVLVLRPSSSIPLPVSRTKDEDEHEHETPTSPTPYPRGTHHLQTVHYWKTLQFQTAIHQRVCCPATPFVSGPRQEVVPGNKTLHPALRLR